MANPSHSTASPDPRNPQDDGQLDSRGRGNDSEANGNDGGGGNPEQTSNSVRPEALSLSKGEGPDGRLGFDTLSPNGILDRRTLLTGAGIGCLIPLIPLIRRPFDAACGVAQDRLDRRIHAAPGCGRAHGPSGQAGG